MHRALKRLAYAVLAAGLIACAPIPMPEGNRVGETSRPTDVARLDVGDPLPDFLLQADDGRIIGPDDLPGDVLLLTFYSGTGPSASSSREILRRVGELLERLVPERRSRVHALAVALEADAAETLSQQAERLGIQGPGWTVASAPRQQLERLAAAFGVAVWPDSETGVGHTLTTTVVASGRVADRFFGIAEWSVPDLLGAVSSAMGNP